MEARMKRFVAIIRAVFIASLPWAAGLAQAIEVAGVNLADLSHYGADSLHSEAAYGSRANGLVIVAYANAKREGCRAVLPRGCTVRA